MTTAPTKRLTLKERRGQILDAALELAARDGYQNITRETVAARAGCSNGLVTERFGTMGQLKRAVIRAAVARAADPMRDDAPTGILRIIAQALADGNDHAKKAPAALRERALATLGV